MGPMRPLEYCREKWLWYQDEPYEVARHVYVNVPPGAMGPAQSDMLAMNGLSVYIELLLVHRRLRHFQPSGYRASVLMFYR